MRRRTGFTLWTADNANGSYHSWERVVGSARWLAAKSGASVRVVDDNNGDQWDVSPSGMVAPHRR
jgi:hypothetical protein